MARAFYRVYSRHFLQTLIPNAAAKLERFPGLFDGKRLLKARTVYEFDDVVTSPLHGFAGADDYWTRCSSKPWLRGIRLPTLVLNAINDPFLPSHALPGPSDVSSTVALEQPHEGGHVGFATGSLPGRLEWLPLRIISFFRRNQQSKPQRELWPFSSFHPTLRDQQ